MNTTTNKQIIFCQSAIANNLEFNPADPLHAELYELFESHDDNAAIAPEHLAKATKLMKRIPGFIPSVSLTNTPAWASDLWLTVR
jgi:hypothetical protein